MAAISTQDEVGITLPMLAWGPEARAQLPLRRFSYDDITVGYGGFRINEKRFSVQIHGKITRPPCKKPRTVAPDVSAVASCNKKNVIHEDDVQQRRIVLIFLTIAVGFLFISFLLVTVSLRLSPHIDELVRKENEELLKILQSSGIAANSRPENSTETPRSPPSSIAPPPNNQG